MSLFGVRLERGRRRRKESHQCRTGQCFICNPSATAFMSGVVVGEDVSNGDRVVLQKKFVVLIAGVHPRKAKLPGVFGCISLGTDQKQTVIVWNRLP